MKKIAFLLALMMLAGCFSACAKKDDAPAAEVPDDEPAAEVPDDAPAAEAVAGGWTLYDGMEENISAEDREVLDKALEGYAGLSVRPIAMLGTQVVAGLNYMFLCETAPVVPNAEKSLSVVIVYRDLEGKASITGVTDFDLGAYAGQNVSVSAEQLAGGWTVNADIPVKELAGDAGKAFAKAFERISAIKYEAVELLGSQVVAGANYAVLCKDLLSGSTPKLCVLTVYAALDGSAEVLSTADIDLKDLNK